jgi:hypothetical protein
MSPTTCAIKCHKFIFYLYLKFDIQIKKNSNIDLVYIYVGYTLIIFLWFLEVHVTLDQVV